jgi:hypothetical protein
MGEVKKLGSEEVKKLGSWEVLLVVGVISGA